jgi:hypothetical protein
MAIHHVSLVLPLERDFPSPIGFLANGGGVRGGDLSNYQSPGYYVCPKIFVPLRSSCQANRFYKDELNAFVFFRKTNTT